MVEVRVCRNSSVAGQCLDDDQNLKWIPDISDQLLTTEAAARERGRVELDKVYSNRYNMDLSLTSFEFHQPGQLVEVYDGDLAYVGLLKSISLSFSMDNDAISVSSQARVEREA